MLSWHQTCNDFAVTGLGCQALLALPMTAFFASRQCPGIAIRAAMDWGLEQVRTREVVISGFHSPLEQSMLNLLLQARSPVVMVLARPVSNARLKPDWRAAIAEGCMAIVSASQKVERLTSERATQRNEWVARLAKHVVIAHASEGGELTRQSESWANQGLSLLNLAL